MSVKEKVRGAMHWCDLYAQPIYLTYNQDSYYRTVMGGVATLLSAILILSFSAEQFVSLFSGNYTETKQRDFTNILRYPNPYNIPTTDFNVGVRIKSYDHGVNASKYLLPTFAFIATDFNTSEGFTIIS
jgi:hypothetical protein